ncbi:hypothetical protein [Halocola ammonii]
MTNQNQYSFALWSLLIMIILYSSQALAQNPECKCCTPQHGQFDFWIGEWIVHDTLGNEVGENSIQKVEGNCLISENWKGSSGSTGRSFNYYDPADSTWNQLWVSSSGNILKLKGNLENGKMILESDFTTDAKGRTFKNRITWYPMEEARKVTQIWEIVNEEDETVAVSFHGIYSRKK